MITPGGYDEDMRMLKFEQLKPVRNWITWLETVGKWETYTR